jgi:hypothetical protein
MSTGYTQKIFIYFTANIIGISSNFPRHRVSWTKAGRDINRIIPLPPIPKIRLIRQEGQQKPNRSHAGHSVYVRLYVWFDLYHLFIEIFIEMCWVKSFY